MREIRTLRSTRRGLKTRDTDKATTSQRWSRRWLYDALGLFNDYRVRSQGLDPA